MTKDARRTDFGSVIQADFSFDSKETPIRIVQAVTGGVVFTSGLLARHTGASPHLSLLFSLLSAENKLFP
jgi:hypothetical protein